MEKKPGTGTGTNRNRYEPEPGFKDLGLNRTEPNRGFDGNLFVEHVPRRHVHDPLKCMKGVAAQLCMAWFAIHAVCNELKTQATCEALFRDVLRLPLEFSGR